MSKFSHPQSLRVAAFLSVLNLAACGGGGGGGGSGATPDTTAPSVAITAPANASSTTSANATVTGTAADTVGVTAVTVNGVAATSTSGTFATWTATVPLALGANTLTATARDAAANTSTASITVTRTDGTAPTVAVVFPTAPSMTTATNVIVRGTASDNISVAGVTVAGVAATSSDGFATWTATVASTALAGGATAVATDGSANTSTAAAVPAVSKVAAFLNRPNFLAYDPASGGILTSDLAHHGIVRVSAATGASTLISTNSVGSGPVPIVASAMVRVSSTTAYLAIGDGNSIVSVDLTTGARTVISSPSVGSGTQPASIAALGYDPVRSRVLVLDTYQFVPTATRILAINPLDGTRTVVAGNGVGIGATSFSGSDLDYDPVGDRYLVGVGSSVLAISPTTGDRTTILSGAPLTSNIRSLALDGSGGLYIFRTTTTGSPTALAGTLLWADLGTSSKFIVDTTALAAVTLQRPSSIAYDPVTHEIFIGDTYGGRIWGVTLSSETVAASVRTVAGNGARIGSGPELVFPGDLALDQTRTHAYVVDSHSDLVMRVDLANGARTIFSGSGAGSGDDFAGPVTINFDAANGRLLVGDQAYGVLEVSLTDGTRTLLYDDLANGSLLQALNDSVYDPVRHRVILASSTAVLYAVDATTGALTTFTTDTASAPNMANVGHLAYRSDLDRYLALDLNGDVFQVDPTDGSRTLLFDNPTPAVGAPLVSRGPIVTDGANAWIFDSLANTATAIVTSSGVGTNLWDGAVDSNPGASNVGGADLDPVKRVIYAVDAGTHALTVMDAVTGERLYLSR